MGKSAAARLLSARGVPLVDTDVVAHQLVEPGQPALDAIRSRFGPQVVGSDGRLRREALAQIVFADPAAREALEAILHPRIREVWLHHVQTWEREGRGVGIVVIPLLFETGAASHFAATICVACSAATQLERLRARGWTSTQITQRIAAQWPVEKKMQAADFVIWSEGSLDVHGQQLERVLHDLGE
jgi:dephospho-CoA kinase